MAKVLITGANRGIGLELARQMRARDDEVYAVCRKASNELKEITPHIIDNIDVSNPSCVDKLKEKLKVDHLDILINMAGILEQTSWESLDFASIERQFQVNAMGPLRITRAVVDLMPKGGKILMITSRMGSIADNTSGSSYGYRMSKAALNIASVSLAHDLKGRGVAVGIVHPGYVKTDMTHHSGLIETDESAKGILARLDQLTLANTGTFWHQNGDILPW